MVPCEPCRCENMQVEYIRQGKLQQAEKVLGDAIADGALILPGSAFARMYLCLFTLAETFKVGARGSAAASDRMVCLVTLAMLYLRLGSGPVDTNTAVTYHRLCEETLTKADAIRGGYYLTAAGRGVFTPRVLFS